MQKTILWTAVKIYHINKKYFSLSLHYGNTLYMTSYNDNDNDNDNDNTLFDHNIQIEITIYKQFK